MRSLSFITLALTLSLSWAVSPCHADQHQTVVIHVDNGLVRLIDDTAIPALASGTIDALHVSEGSWIKRGQLLASVDAKAVTLQVEAAKLELETAERHAANELDILEAEKSAAVAKAELDRVVAANRKTPNTFLAGEVDRFRLLHERAELGVQRARYSQEIAAVEVRKARTKIATVEEALLKHQIISPCNGIVSKVGSRLGEWIEPGQMMFQVIDTGRLQIDGFVQADVAKLAWIGTAVKIRIPDRNPNNEKSSDHLPDNNVDPRIDNLSSFTNEVAGTITFISPEINPVDSTARILVEFDNSSLALRPGKRITVEVAIEVIPEK